MSNILIASAYKSGSNHIADSLANALGARRTHLIRPKEGWAGDAQSLDARACEILFNRFNGMVYLQHICGTPSNLGLLRVFQPHVIVIQRKLLPTLHSLRKYGDKMMGDGKIQTIPFISHWDSLTSNDKWRWVAYNTIPWLYQFYVSWQKQADDPRLLHIWYEDHFADQIASAQGMLNFLGEPEIPRKDLEKAFFHKDSNYTQDRTELRIPEFVKDIALAQAWGWGIWSEKIARDLIGE
jgi:hypothetical protein